ncbi:MAG: A/G-specific adenine glycosylase [Ferruginibacter sp.]
MIINTFVNTKFLTANHNKGNSYWFTTQLLEWNHIDNDRMMPWKGEKDPYKIWLSEIILQQTRVEQGRAYYNRFINQFPTIQQLASATDITVFKLWEGLGYYSRCKNLLETARFISGSLAGIFPRTYDEILQLKGIGPYTAAAISSFAYDLPHAVVDGNVMRVLARFFAIGDPVDSTVGKKLFTSVAGKLLDTKSPATYNQAIMDFGATVCKPQSPLCSSCCLVSKCAAFRSGSVDLYPVKINKLVKRNRWFYYIVAEYKGKFLIRKRTRKDIWQNLYEFILVENDKIITYKKLLFTKKIAMIIGDNYKVLGISKQYRQQLTHQTIHGCFIHIEWDKKHQLDEFIAVTRSGLDKLAFPRFITKYFADEGHRFSNQNGKI